MSVLNPRNRLVNFRLSEIEFEQLKEACARQGARSISDFARTSVMRSLDEPLEPSAPQYGRTPSLDRKVAELEVRVEQLLRLLGTANVQPAPPASPLPLSRERNELPSSSPAT